MRSGKISAGVREMELFEEFLAMARLHKNYSQHFYPPDLYAMDLIEDRRDLGPSEISALWERYAAELPSGQVNLYITTPFCFRHCSYCLFFKDTVRRAADLEEYKDRLVGLGGAFAPLFSRLKFSNLFFGGGTPSLFTAPQLREICEKVIPLFKVARGGSRTFECEPLTATKEKLEIIAAAGFNRVSVGVQSLDRKVLKTLNRDYQEYGMVRDFLSAARGLGFSLVNVDLMIGVSGDTPRAFLAGFERVLKLRPTTIAVYQIVPNQEYLDAYHGGSKEDFFAYSLEFRKKVHPELARIARENGFTCPNLAKFCMENKMAGSVVFQDAGVRIRQEYSMNEIGPEDSYLTFGHRGDSYIPGIAFYQTTPLTRDPADNVFKTTLLDRRRAMEFYCLWKLSSFNDLDRAEFRRLFGRDILAELGPELREFERAGCAKVLKDKVVFVKTDIKTRFLVSMVFMGRARLIRRINAWLRERAVALRFGEFSYRVFAEYAPGRRLAARVLPMEGSKRSKIFEERIGSALAGLPAGGLTESLAAFERAMLGLEAGLRRRVGVKR